MRFQKEEEKTTKKYKNNIKKYLQLTCKYFFFNIIYNYKNLNARDITLI